MTNLQTCREPCESLIPVPLLTNLTEIQNRYRYDEEHRFIVAAAGRRSRKTLIAKRKVLYRALDNPDQLIFHAAPTRDQAKQIFWDDLKRYTKHIRTYCNESELYVRLMNGSEIHVIGMDRPERIEGRTRSWTGCHLAEFGDFKPNAWGTNIRPVLADTGGWAIIDGVPDPFKANFANHRKMAQDICGTIPTIVPGKGAYAENGEWAFYSWFSSDVLPPDEIAGLKAESDPQTFRIEYEASFETIAGRVYYGYTPDYWPNGNLDKTVKYDKHLPIIMCMDFNVSPMTAILGHVIINPETGKEEYHIFKGYFLKDCNTRTLIERVITDYPDTYTYYVTPCQSSISRQTSQEITKSGFKTDLSIIKDVMFSYQKNIVVNKRSKNPIEADAVKAVNSMLYNRRIRINPDDAGCKELQNDFERLTYKEGTTSIDESDKMRNHISKAVSYLCEKYWPIRSESNQRAELNIIV